MIPKTAEYALRAAVCLAGTAGSPASADLLAAGLLTSKPGPGGGHELARPAGEVTILDVVNAVAPIERIEHCPLGLPSHTSLCPLHRELDRAYETMQEAFRRVSLKDLLESTSPIIPLCDLAASAAPAASGEAGGEGEQPHREPEPGVGQGRGRRRG